MPRAAAGAAEDDLALPRLSTRGYTDWAGAFALEEGLSLDGAALEGDISEAQLARMPAEEQRKQRRLVRCVVRGVGQLCRLLPNPAQFLCQEPPLCAAAPHAAARAH